MAPSNLPGYRRAVLVTAGAFLLSQAALIQAAFALSSLQVALLGQGIEIPWWPRLERFVWLTAGVQAIAGAWGGVQVWRRRPTLDGMADLRAAIWLICFLHLVQGAGSGAIVPADAPFRPAPLATAVLAVIATAMLTFWLKRFAAKHAGKAAEPPRTAPSPLSTSNGAAGVSAATQDLAGSSAVPGPPESAPAPLLPPQTAPQDAAQNATDNLAANLAANRSSGTAGHGAEQRITS